MARLMPRYFTTIVLAAIAFSVADQAACAQLGRSAGDVEPRYGAAPGQIVCDGRMGCAPLRPGCRLVRGGGSFDTAVVCAGQKGRKGAKQRSMSGSEN